MKSRKEWPYVWQREELVQAQKKQGQFAVSDSVVREKVNMRKENKKEEKVERGVRNEVKHILIDFSSVICR